MNKYINGNSTVEIFEDGTRVIQFEDQLQLDYPLNIDIRVSSRCTFGYNPKTGKAFCDFCHESARTDGDECDYEKLKEKLIDLPRGIELAIGANNITLNLVEFISWCKLNGYIVNLTVNQGHVRRDSSHLYTLIDQQLIKGLGVSYRSSLKWDIPDFILDYKNTVFHVIAGIDSIDDVLSLKDKGVKKVLVLGEKNFGFNEGKVDLTTRNHREWYWWVGKMFDTFDVTSFDNLALEQLNMKRFFSDENWDIFNQGEHSFYVNAVEQYFAPSSRSNLKTDWNMYSLKEYFHNLELTK
ncbi:MAG: hypothetical protein E6R13_01545 [Spirochaetes bacterium]|nr:MAG: hypothetical protein E6R13_01545 [Spirochaetota bacterium]